MSIKIIKKKHLESVMMIWNDVLSKHTSTKKIHTIESITDWWIHKKYEMEIYGYFINDILVGICFTFGKENPLIKFFAIAEKYQGKGFGKKLIKSLVRKYKENIKYEVMINNISALNFIINCGFIVDYLEEDNSEFIMKYKK